MKLAANEFCVPVKTKMLIIFPEVCLIVIFYSNLKIFGTNIKINTITNGLELRLHAHGIARIDTSSFNRKQATRKSQH